MFTRYILPLVAVCGLSYAIYNVIVLQRVPPPSQPLVSPPTAPLRIRSIAGAGIVEAKKENIPIGTAIPGVVDRVDVVIGAQVKAGDPLFHIDDRDLRAELISREATVAAMRAQLDKLKAAPRPEDVPPAQAAVEEMRAKLADARASYRRTKSLFDRSMATGSDYDKDNYSEKAAEAALAKAEAELKKILAGSWVEDIKVAEAALQQAKAQVESIKIQLERLTVRALTDGEVLQVHVRPGQYAAVTWNEALVVLGDVKTLHVRVDIDENDLAMFKLNADAVATLKGRPGVRFPLDFVKVEPYVIPKKSLTGDNSERVDTRVLQVVYALRDAPMKVFVGQQMDVYLRAEIPNDFLRDANPDVKKPFEEEPVAKPKPAA